MKPISVLAVAASIAVLSTVGCKKDEPRTSETNTTGAQITPEPPATEPVKPLPVQPQMSTGSATDTTTSDQSGMRQNEMINKGKDAGVASDFPTGGSDLIDRQNQTMEKSNAATGTQKQGSSVNKDQQNHSTPLGDSKSGEYTGGKGTYGGKATWGTGTPKKDTQMDQPEKKK